MPSVLNLEKALLMIVLWMGSWTPACRGCSRDAALC